MLEVEDIGISWGIVCSGSLTARDISGIPVCALHLLL